jgi:putative effector of murein hydrolase
MAKSELADLSQEDLRKKEKGVQTLIGISIVLFLGLAYSVIRGYLKGGELDWAILTIAICTLALPVTFYSELKAVRQEWLRRD